VAVLNIEGVFIKAEDAIVDVNQIESLDVLSIGIGTIAGSLATTQGFSRGVLPSIFFIGLGVAVMTFGKYR
jgi:hypothetical protein